MTNDHKFPAYVC